MILRPVLATLLLLLGASRPAAAQQPGPYQPLPSRPTPSSPPQPPGYVRPYPGYAPPPPPPPRRDHEAAAAGVGAWGGVERLSASEQSSAPAFQLGLWLDQHRKDSRTSVVGSIGGGPWGLESRVSLAALLGGRFGDDEQGLLVRAGMSLDRWKNDHLFVYQFTLPVIEIGYQYLDRDTLAEASLFGGGMLLGQMTLGNQQGRVFVMNQIIDTVEVDRFATDSATLQARRPFGFSGEVGAQLALQRGPLRLTGQVMRLFSRTEPGTPIDAARGQLCGSPPVVQVMLCADAAAYRADLRIADGVRSVEAAGAYLGLVIGYGDVGIDAPFLASLQGLRPRW